MDTRRCVYCQSLQRADAQKCRRCGRLLPSLQEEQAQYRHGLPEASPVSHVAQDIPAPHASPHHAGHSFGLHPEDQPYQSSMLPAHATSSLTDNQERVWHTQSEPERILFPPTGEARALKQARQQALKRGRETSRLNDEHAEDAYAPRSERQRVTHSENKSTRDLGPASAAGTTPVPGQQMYSPATVQPYFAYPPYPAYKVRKTLFSSRTNSVVLTLTCILFLLAASIIAFVLIGRPPARASASVRVVPSTVHASETFTLSGDGFAAHHVLSLSYDSHDLVVDEKGDVIHAQTDGAGSFKVLARLPATLTVGKHLLSVTDTVSGAQTATSITVVAGAPAASPVLRLSQSVLHFSFNGPGVSSRQPVTLTNGGDGTLFWHVSSDQSWLTVNPMQGAFTRQQTLQITVRSTGLAGGSNIAHLTFVQDGGSHLPALTMPVTVTEDTTTVSVPAPAAVLTVAPVDLNYTASTVTNPPDQAVTLTNESKQPISWSASSTTDDGASWLAVTPTGDSIDAGKQETVTVSVNSLLLSPGSYHGVITIGGTTGVNIAVSLTVATPSKLVAVPATLRFDVPQGNVSAAHPISIRNAGGSALTWFAQAKTDDGAPWLRLSASTGTLNAGAQTTISIGVQATNLGPQSYHGIVILTSSGTVRIISVTLNISAPGPVPSSTPPLSSPTPTPTPTSSATQALPVPATKGAQR